VPRQRGSAPDPVVADDRLVEAARRGRLSAEDPDPLARLLVALAARCPADRRGSAWVGTTNGPPGRTARRRAGGAPAGT
jgi:hypothetical protein